MFESFNRYIGVQGVLALVLVGSVVGMAVSGHPVPDILGSLASAAAGFYFGSKGGQLNLLLRARGIGMPVFCSGCGAVHWGKFTAVDGWELVGGDARGAWYECPACSKGEEV